MKRKILSLLMLLMAVSGAWADGSGTPDDPWISGDCTLILSEGTLTVSKKSGTGAMADIDYYDNTPWYSKKGDIKSIVIGSGVTSIGDYAFEDCNNLASVSIPASVTRLGDHAFQNYGTNATLTVTFAEGTSPMTIGEYAFKNTNLTSITIPNRVTSIGNYAFGYCTNLASVSIPASVTSIGVEAFLQCGRNAAALTVTFAEGTSPMTIGSAAFAESNLTSITIPNRVTSIGNYAFYDNSNLASVYVMASTPPALGTDAFKENASGRKIYVPASSVGDASTDGTYKHNWSAYADDIEAFPVTATGDCGTNCTYTLYGNGQLVISGSGAMADYNNLSSRPWYDYRSSITTVNIENGVTSIGKYAFEQFDKMTSITIGDGVTSIGDYAFRRCKGLTSLTVPNGLATIGEDVFVGCIGLATITVASGNTAFKAENGVLLTDDGTELVLYPAAKAATTYTIPDYVTTIRDCAFYKCNLTEVTIPASVTNIGQQAFCECSNLATVTLLPVTPPTLGVSVFDDIGTNVNSNDKKFYFHGTAYGSNTDWNVSGYTPTVIYGATLSSGATTSTEAICSEGTTKYYTEGTSITLGHGDAPTGYTFGGYTSKDAADNDITATAISGSTLTMPASDVTVSVSFKKLLTNTDITIAEIADQTYTGSEIKPAVTVKDGETDITDQCDITYTNNTNAGTATVTIKAKASSTSYAGETTKSFKIILTGDINGDNVVNVADIVKAINDGKSQDEIKKIEKIIMNK